SSEWLDSMRAKKTAPEGAVFSRAALRSAERHRNEHARVLALDQEGDVAVRPVDELAQLIDVLHRLVVHPEDDVARLDAGLGRRPGGVLDDDTGLGAELLAFLSGERAYRDAELALGLRLLLFLGLRFRDLLLVRRASDLHAQVARLTLAQHLQRDGGAGL